MEVAMPDCLLLWWFLPVVTMQNEEGKMVDLYVPRKW